LERPRGVGSHCRACCAKQSNARYRKNKTFILSRQKEYYRKAKKLHPVALHKYGITHQQYMEMWEKQKGLCPICHHPERCKRRKWLAVDHDHSTGKIRALLCDKCNLGIGHFKDDIALLESAISYIKEHKELGASRCLDQ
jgi:hypothetical protein